MGQRMGGNVAAAGRGYQSQNAPSAQQQQLMYQQHKNSLADGRNSAQRQDLSSKVMENQARASQLREQIDRQKASI